jgi:hypothetical protein
MGVSSEDLELFIRLKEQGYIPNRGSIAELGAQQLSNSVLRSGEQVKRLGQLFGVHSAPPLGPPLPTTVNEFGRERSSADAPFAGELWRWLGLSYSSLDVDCGPDGIALDLNYDDVPDDLASKCHLVTNFGTTEHVANQLNAFKVAHDLTAPGGIMIHKGPAQGGFNHGLVNYTPKFFWMLARSNDYRWLWFDFKDTTAPHSMPANLIDSVRPFRPEIDEMAKTYRVAECSITVVFLKEKDAPYVPPLDVPPAAISSSEILFKRYWSVLKSSG